VHTELARFVFFKMLCHRPWFSRCLQQPLKLFDSCGRITSISESEDLTSARNCSLRVLLDKRTCHRKIVDSETIAHDRPDDCLQCDWLPFPCAIRVNRRTAAAAE
jgi:hypothetical protein